MNLYTDDDVERGVTALLDSREQTPFIAEHIAAVLDAVLPAYRKRLLNELADALEGQTVMGPQVFAARHLPQWHDGWNLGVQQVIANIRLRAKGTP